MNIKQKAEQLREFLRDLNTEIINNSSLAKVYSDVSTLEGKLGMYKTIFEKNFSDYRRLEPLFNMKPNVYKDDFDRADIDLRNTVQEIEKILIREVFPNLKGALKGIEEKVESGEIKIEENMSLKHDIPPINEENVEESSVLKEAGKETKSAFKSKIKRIGEWIDRTVEFGEKIEKAENFYSKYGKYIVKGIGKLITYLLL